MSINFERAKLLMETIVEAGKHGPMYQVLAGEAGAELKKMIDDHQGKKPEVKPVTPAAGPANAAVQQRDGTVRQVDPPVPPITPEPLPRPGNPEYPNRTEHGRSIDLPIERKV